MCGISGIFNFATRQDVDPLIIQRMNDAQAYRGPDEQGAHVAGNIGLGNRRLAIIDRARGQQPMSIDEPRLWITYNGEVFNYHSLRESLQTMGRRFRTNCDTEVVLHAYAVFGEDCVQHFNGQFAFAIWDERNARLFLARDHLGIAPLHYATHKGVFCFASEAKAILAHPDLSAAIDGESIVEALLCGTLFNGRTMFAGISSLEPGHTMTVTAAGITSRRYWDIPVSCDETTLKSERQYQDEILPLLDDALKLRTVGEVPWGLMLSGGTDSSTLARLANNMVADPLQTFTIDFPNPWKPAETDARYARLMAERLGSRHREFIIEPDEYYATLEQVAWHLERPFNKGASTMYLLYRHLHDHVTVVITGEGADELFAGYVGERGLGLDEIMAAGRIEQLPWAAYWRVTNQLFSPEFRKQYRPEEIFHQRLADALAAIGPGEILNQALYLYTKYFLLELLELHDRTSLAFGVEARLPFLDYRLVELISAMPPELKFRDGRTKYIFKEAVRDLLPAQIIERKKTPMPIPRDPQTLLGQIQLTEELVCSPGSRTAAYYDTGKVRDFLHRGNEFSNIDALSIWKVSMYLITLEMLSRAYHL